MSDAETSTVAVTAAIDAGPLRHLAVRARGLVRLRVENRGAAALPNAVVALTLSGEALPSTETGPIAAGGAAIAAIAVVPGIAGYHELAGEIRAGDARFRIAPLHIRVGGDGPQVNVVNIDQSSARVVDNSRSTFGADDGGGLVGDGKWQAIALERIAEILPPAAPPPGVYAVEPAPVFTPVDFQITTETAAYHVTTTLARGDIATVYGGRTRDGAHADVVAVKIADQSSDNDLLQHEARVLGLLLAKDHKTAIHFAAPRDQFRTGDGRLGSVFPRLDGLDLTQLRDRFRARGEPGLPARHVVWILRRALAALGWTHQQGILHGNIQPAHILIRAHDHMLWLVDWCWAVVDPAHTGQGFKALDEVYSPPEVAARGKPTPASDLYALGKCAIHVVGGDPATKALPDIDARLARFLRYLCVESQGGRPQDAWELYLQIDKIRQQIWGEHEFVTLDL